jgi:serine/threonine protein kinase
MREINKGDVINGRYRVDGSLGRGGMADVYKVWDTQRSVFLAMKVLRQDLAQDPIFLRRFQREAKALAKLQHPNIVRFYGLERDDLLAYLLMEYVDGVSLQAEIIRHIGRPLAPERIQHVMAAACVTLNYAHSVGIVHCDIKPGNILIDRNGNIFLTDFGIARGMDSATSTMVGIGTPAYMAPELIRGEDPTPQTDIYALGIVLYEMLTGGERPFTGERATITGTASEKVRWEQVNRTPVPLRQFNPQVTPQLENVVMRCLKKEPQKRFANTLDLLQSFENVFVPEQHVSITRAETSHNEARTIEPPQGNDSIYSIPVHSPTGMKEKTPRVGLWIFVGLIAISLLFVFGRIIADLSQSNRNSQAARNPAERTISATATYAPTPTLQAKPQLGSASQVLSVIDEPDIPFTSSYTFLHGSKPVLYYQGWEAIDSTTLTENMEKIEFEFRIDGELIPDHQIASKIVPLDESEILISAIFIDDWPEGTYELESRLIIKEMLNDGWSDYEPQTLAKKSVVTVSKGSQDSDHGNWPIVYYDGFSRDNGDWWTGTLASDWYGYDGETSIANGSYNMRIDYSDKEVIVDGNDPDLLAYGDFYLSADLWSEGEPESIHCAGLSFLDYYDFDICDDGTYAVFYSEFDGEWLIDWTDSEDINIYDKNEISILSRNGSLSFFINGIIQNEIPINNYDFGKIGVDVVSYGFPATYYFDDITLRMP